MEVAGVALGGVGIIGPVLKSYEYVYDTAKRHINWQDTIGTIRRDLFLQKEQLDITLRGLGLKDPTMADIEATLRIRHPEKCESLMEIIQDMDNYIRKMDPDLQPDAKGSPPWDDSISKRENLANKANWERRRIKRSFGEKRRKETYEYLEQRNNALRHCLEKREITPDSGHRVLDIIRSRFDKKQIAILRESALKLHKAMKSGFGCTCSYVHRGNIQLNWHKKEQLASGAFLLALSSNPLSPGQQGISRSRSTPRRSKSNVRTPSSSKRSSPLSHDITNRLSDSSSQISVASTLAVPQSSPPTTLIRLCETLKSCWDDQAALGCIPIPDSDPRKQVRITGKGSEAKQSNPSTKRPVQLSKFLSRSTDASTNKTLVLNRKQRYGIAAALTWAVLHLCDSPWLESEVKNDEIHMFLESRGGTTTASVSEHPYLAHSFPPPGAPAAPTPAPLSIVAQFQNNQIQNMAVFTLALRLIELGRNRTFDQLRQDSSPRTPNPSPTAIDDFEVAQRQILELSLDEGRLYANAADRCLRFLFPGPADENTFQHSSFRETFFADVVAPVQAIYELDAGTYSEFAS
ncbi:hypothetical protein K505DRAFT_245115 [Melanomma pulvis-pyrius CBS 109.77]|uniref:DUF7580 domain-containing protein n=1 Tax=Melanomma pulvis-pyrius CBS 109.77 TaxID=1314802 RepID=A0A6A6XBP0_9PLEO|nr:hypothetical protein K505DRAFT_245115 [Melanomma pulvis-pyrius CBS 109.77]